MSGQSNTETEILSLNRTLGNLKDRLDRLGREQLQAKRLGGEITDKEYVELMQEADR